MQPATSGSTFQWRDFLKLGEELLKQPDSLSLQDYLVHYIASRLSCVAAVWLAEPYYPLPGERPVTTIPSSPAPDFVLRVLKRRRAVFCSNGVLLRSPTNPDTLGIPLIAQDDLLGVISVSRESGTPFLEDEVQFLQGITTSAALAMQVNRQAAIKNWRYDQISLVRSVSAQIANVLDLDELCKRVTNLIQCSFNFYHVAIFTIEPGCQELHFRASSLECEPNTNHTIPNIRFGEGLIGSAAETGKEIIVQDVTKESRFKFSEKRSRTKAEAVLPLMVENKLLGILDLQSESGLGFHENDLLVLRSLADNIALAIESAALFNKLEQRAKQLQAVSDISYALSSILEMDKLLKEIVEVIHQQFAIPFVHIFTVHSERRKIIYQAGTGVGPRRLKPNSLAFDLDDSSGIIPQVARSGEHFLANDVSLEPLYRPYKNFPDQVKSELAIPLKFGNTVLGILDLQSDVTNRFTADDLELFQSHATGISLALRNASLFRTEKWRRQVADSFRDIAGLLSSNMALPDLLDRVLIALETNLPCDVSAIWLLDEAGDVPLEERKLRLAAVRGTTADKVINTTAESQMVRMFLQQGIDSKEVQLRKPGEPHGPLGAARKFPANYSSLLVPLRSGDDIFGVLTLAHRAKGRYGAEASAIASTLANYAAVAIQNARLYTSAQEEAWSSTVLLQVAEAMQSINTQDALLSTMARLTPLLVGIDQCAFYLTNPNTDTFELKKWYGFQPDENERALQDSDSIALLKLRTTLAPVFISDPATELSLCSMAHSQETGTLVLLPLLAHGELHGAFLVSHNSKGEFGILNPFSNQTLAILQGIAQQTAVGLENIRLLENRQEEAYITAVLLQVAQAVVSQNELEDILDTIIQIMSILVGVDCSVIYLWHAESSKYIPARAVAPGHEEETLLLQRSFAPGEFALLDQLIVSEKMSACRLETETIDASHWPDLECISSEEELSKTESSWLLGFPLVTKGEKYGVLLTRETRVPAAYFQKRIELLRGVAQQTTLAIQNDRMTQEMVKRKRVEQEFSLARQIQRTFLPETIPAIDGWDMNLRWRTAREVGGDFYDVFLNRKKQLSFVIADVSDKGMPAALYMTVTRTLIRSAAQSMDSPAEVLKRVNELLEMDTQNGMFVTAIYATLDQHTGLLTYANAGHNLPLLLRSETGKVERLRKGAIALGVISKADYQDCRIQIDPGDSLLFYTDGVTETFSLGGEIFGEERLFQALASSNVQSAEELLEELENEINTFRQGEAPTDDMTMIALHRIKTETTSRI